MSRHAYPARRRRGCALALSILVIGAVPSGSSAEDNAFDAWARWASYTGRWKGPTVMVPDVDPRPRLSGYRLDSTFEALHVHAAEGVDRGRAERALAAAESTLQRLRADGWPIPVADGGRGGTPGLDVYLEAGVQGATAGLDGEDGASLYDGGIGFVRVDAFAPALDACVASGVAQAGLLANDVAEARAWRVATGTLVAHLVTGEFGCAGDGTGLLEDPEQGFGHADSGEEGALWLAMLSDRVDGGSGRFVRDMWHFAQQDSGTARLLRASPDLWEAIERALDNAGQSLDDLLVESAVARYFTGRHGPPLAEFPTLIELGSPIEVPVRAELDGARLPRHLTSERGLLPLGSSYTLVHIKDAHEHDQLQVWLRGELGPRWSLAAVQLDRAGREIGRLVAPARRTPRSYLPIWLSHDAHAVVLVVTRLPTTVPDADIPTPPPAHYKLIVDLQRGSPRG